MRFAETAQAQGFFRRAAAWARSSAVAPDSSDDREPRMGEGEPGIECDRLA